MPWLAGYLGWAMVYAAAATAVVGGLLRVTRHLPAGARGTAVLLALLAGAFVLFLGLHPFPDPARFSCASDARAPILEPFAFRHRFAQLWRDGAALQVWMRDLTVVSTVMNFVLCGVMGAALRGASSRVRVALLAGAGLSVTIETAQVTGLFGVYGCAYRTLEVDDLILNTAGSVAGFLVASAVLRRVAGP